MSVTKAATPKWQLSISLQSSQTSIQYQRSNPRPKSRDINVWRKGGISSEVQNCEKVATTNKIRQKKERMEYSYVLRNLAPTTLNTCVSLLESLRCARWSARSCVWYTTGLIDGAIRTGSSPVRNKSRCIIWRKKWTGWDQWSRSSIGVRQWEWSHF